MPAFIGDPLHFHAEQAMVQHGPIIGVTELARIIQEAEHRAIQARIEQLPERIAALADQKAWPYMASPLPQKDIERAAQIVFAFAKDVDVSDRGLAIRSLGEPLDAILVVARGLQENRRLTAEALAAVLCDACAGCNVDPASPHSVSKRVERFPIKPSPDGTPESERREEAWRHRYHGKDYGRNCYAAHLWEWVSDPAYDPWGAMRRSEQEEKKP